MKCVMVIDAELPLGLIANTAAVLGMSIGERVEGVIGADLTDQDGTRHPGITRLVIPLLKGNREVIRQVREKARQLAGEDVYYVDFCDVAQESKHYEDYSQRLAQRAEAELNYLGVALCGPDKKINSITGSLGLLR